MKCALSGMEIVFPTLDVHKDSGCDKNTLQRLRIGAGMVQIASLDRVDSTLPYEIGNVQWTNKYINVMKNGFSQEEFIFYCHKVAELHANHDLSKLKGHKKSKLKSATTRR